jgi:hypothetical protein
MHFFGVCNCIGGALPNATLTRLSGITRRLKINHQTDERQPTYGRLMEAPAGRPQTEPYAFLWGVQLHRQGAREAH